MSKFSFTQFNSVTARYHDGCCNVINWLFYQVNSGKCSRLIQINWRRVYYNAGEKGTNINACEWTLLKEKKEKFTSPYVARRGGM